MEFAEKKIKKPCKGCPFARVNDNEKPHPGGSPPEVYLGQARGPFWLPCHSDGQYEGKNSDASKVQQCAGAAIFRANAKQPYKLPDQLLSLEEDHENVFSTPAEFFAYYYGIPLERAQELMTEEALDRFLALELMKQEAKPLT